MYARGKTGPVPSDAQAREKLTVYVYEYLHHVGAANAAETFLKEIRWDKGQITPNEHPGFLHSWWCVFWDLYCAAPERRESFPHSKEASSFHDYTVMTSTGYPLSPNMNGMGVGMPPGQPPPHHPHNMGEGGAGSGPGSSPALHQLGGPGMPDGSVGGGMPPGFFPGSHLRPSPSQMMSHGGMPLMPPQPSNMQPHPHPGHPGQPPPQGGHGPRGYAPSSNRSSPAARMAHPGQQQIDFGPPPGAMMMGSEGPQGMMMGRGGGGRAGMPPSPMPPGAYGGPQGPGGMQRMHNPGVMSGGSPSSGGNMIGGMPSMHHQRQPWQHGGPGSGVPGGPMSHYSTPSPPNGPGGYMSMMGPPGHMQNNQESVLSGGSESIYGMMKGGNVTDRFGNSINDPSMANMGIMPGNMDMGVAMNGDGMELKHSPGINGGDVSGGRNVGGNMNNVVDEYGLGQFSAAAVASAASASSQD